MAWLAFVVCVIAAPGAHQHHHHQGCTCTG
jgi:hypothetical protein